MRANASVLCSSRDVHPSAKLLHSANNARSRGCAAATATQIGSQEFRERSDVDDAVADQVIVEHLAWPCRRTVGELVVFNRQDLGMISQDRR